MLQRRTLETLVGLFVAAGLAALTMLAFRVANLTAQDLGDGYQVKARFDNIGGLKAQAPVTVSGVRVGRVAQIYIGDDYQAVVVMTVSGKYRLPKDTAASVLTSGLLGEQYVGLDPGGSPDYLQDGEEIRLTQSALVLERIIGQFLYSKASEGQAQ